MHNSNFTIGIFTASAFVGRMSVALSVGGVGNINWGFIRRNTFHSSALRGLPKGLQVDEAVILGKDKSNNSENQQSMAIQSSQQTSAQQPNSEKVEG